MGRKSTTGVEGLQLRSDGRYRIHFKWHDESGDYHEFSKLLPEGTPKTAAKFACEKFRAERVRGTLRTPKQHRIERGAASTLREALDQYLDHMKVARPRTIADRRSLARVLVKVIGNVPIAKLSAFHVSGFQAKRAKEDAAPATINRGVAMLRHACKLAVRQKWGWMTRERLAEISDVEMREEPTGRSVTWSADELRRLFAARKKENGATLVNEHVARVVRASLFSGMRQAEILTLRKTQIDAKGRTLSLRGEDTKNKRPHVVPITKELRAILDAAIAASPDDCEFVFTNQRGKPFSLKSFSGYFAKLVTAAKIEERTFHDLRRTAGTHLINAGVPIEVVSKILGHSQIAVTARSYAHLQVDSLRSAMAVLGKLDGAGRVGKQKGHGAPKGSGASVATLRLERQKPARALA